MGASRNRGIEAHGKAREGLDQRGMPLAAGGRKRRGLPWRVHRLLVSAAAREILARSATDRATEWAVAR